MGKGFNPNQGPPMMVPNLGAGASGPSQADIDRLLQQQQDSLDISLRMGIVSLFGDDQLRRNPASVIESAGIIENYVRHGVDQRSNKLVDVLADAGMDTGTDADT